MRMIETKNSKIAVFDGPIEYAEFMRSIPRSYHAHDVSWAGGTVENNIQRLEQGELKNMARAKDIVSKIDVADLLTQNQRLLETNIAGFVPCVPAYLSGQPETMFDLIETEQRAPITPIRIVIETNVRSYVTHEQILNRGLSIAAFVMALNTIRPVELYTLGANAADRGPGSYGAYGCMVKVFDSYMDISKALFMLCEVGFARAINLTAVGYLLNDPGFTGWSVFRKKRGAADYDAAVKELLDLGPDDVFLCGAAISNGLVLTDPIAWVNRMVRQHSGKEGQVA